MPDQATLSALGPLAGLYVDPAVTEIIVDAPKRVLVEHNGRLEETSVAFASEAAQREVMKALLALGGLFLAAGQTIADARLADGSRVLAIFPPTATNGPCLVIRKRFTSTLTWDKLLEWDFITPEAVDALKGAFQAHANLLVSGGTGSGKTTFANLLTELIPAHEHVVVVEEIKELQVHHTRSVWLEAATATRLPMDELLSAAAKLRADWLIVGELTGPAAARTLEIFGHGHAGLTTLHASSVEDALSRLEVMCLKANLGLGLGEIRALIASAFRLITFQERLENGARRLTQIVELRGLENDHYVLCPLFRHSPISRRLEPTGDRPRWRG